MELDRAPIIQEFLFDKQLLFQEGYLELLRCFMAASIEFQNFKYLGLLQELPSDFKEALKDMTEQPDFLTFYLRTIKDLINGVERNKLEVHTLEASVKDGLTALKNALHAPPRL